MSRSNDAFWRGIEIGGAKGWLVGGPFVIAAAIYKDAPAVGLVGALGMLMAIYILVVNKQRDDIESEPASTSPRSIP